eukprot:1345487-Amorphochlora_amoeboformis.AAC.3
MISWKISPPVRPTRCSSSYWRLFNEFGVFLRPLWKSDCILGLFVLERFNIWDRPRATDGGGGFGLASGITGTVPACKRAYNPSASCGTPEDRGEAGREHCVLRVAAWGVWLRSQYREN